MVCAGFDGSDVDDFSALRAETVDGFQFTPTYDIGGDRFPAIWDPAAHGGRVPRAHVHAAVAQLFAQHQVLRFYCDPPDWKTEIEQWALEYGDKKVVFWPTNRRNQMADALSRFVTDLSQGGITHDGCEITTRHIENARKTPIPGPPGRYILSKPHGAYHQKIDAAMASVLAHEAKCDALAAGENVEDDEYAYVM